jgi:hypothetical protein
LAAQPFDFGEREKREREKRERERRERTREISATVVTCEWV